MGTEADDVAREHPAALIADTFAEVPRTVFREVRATHAASRPDHASVEAIVSSTRREIAAFSWHLAVRLARLIAYPSPPGGRRRRRRASPEAADE